ncbi:hypothetical protein SAMN06272735_4082 [Streptomyces sp. TLI_55]|nr:hypothetical protein SAMN06272735_4082 [Streptomyces sp. TLI_55]
MRSTSTPRKNRRINLISLIAVALLVVAPLYLLAVTVAIRSNLFDFDKGALDAKDTKALWAFIGSGIAAAVTLTGLLVTANHNRQAERRLGLDTAVKGIALTHREDGSYAQKAVLAGALSTLVHLYHPVIAMRMLSATWREDAADTASAIWIIDEVLEDGTPESQIEAARLFYQHADQLCYASAGQYEFPAILEKKWPAKLPWDARLALLTGLPKFLTSKPKQWWTDGHHWICPLLEAVIKDDNDKSLKAFAHDMLERLLSDVEPSDAAHRLGNKKRTFSEMKKTIDDYTPKAGDRFTDAETQGLLARVQDWMEGKTL